MNENEMIPAQAATAIVSSEHPNILVNKGPGLQVQANNGTINNTVNFNLDTSNAESINALLFAMFNARPADPPQTHAIEWSSLSRECYCLFVLENEEYKDKCFCISKNRALQNHTPKDIQRRYQMLSPENVEELKSMPCIFAKRNMHYNYTESYHPAIVGRITDIKPQGETIKIYFDFFQSIPQQLINQNVGLFRMASASMRNELDMEHWEIKQCSLPDVLSVLGIEIR